MVSNLCIVDYTVLSISGGFWRSRGERGELDRCGRSPGDVPTGEITLCGIVGSLCSSGYCNERYCEFGLGA